MIYTLVSVLVLGIGIARGQYYWALDIGCLSCYCSNHRKHRNKWERKIEGSLRSGIIFECMFIYRASCCVCTMHCLTSVTVVLWAYLYQTPQTSALTIHMQLLSSCCHTYRVSLCWPVSLISYFIARCPLSSVLFSMQQRMQSMLCAIAHLSVCQTGGSAKMAHATFTTHC